MLTTIVNAITTSAASTSAVTTSAVTTSAASSSAITTSATTSAVTTSVVSMTSVVGLAFGGVLAVVALILLLSTKEIFSASKYYDRRIEYVLNTSILPLLIAFSAIVIFKVIEVLR